MTAKENRFQEGLRVGGLWEGSQAGRREIVGRTEEFGGDEERKKGGRGKKRDRALFRGPDESKWTGRWRAVFFALCRTRAGQIRLLLLVVESETVSKVFWIAVRGEADGYGRRGENGSNTLSLKGVPGTAVLVRT